MHPARRRLLVLQGAAPWQNNGTWNNSDLPFANVPTLGSEALTDGALENWTNPTTPTSWTKSVAGTSTVNQETSSVHGGSNAARMDIDGSNSNCQITQTIATPVATWVQANLWTKGSVGTLTFSWTNSGGTDLTGTIIPTTSYTQIFSAFRTNAATLGVRRRSATSNSLYFDDLSMKSLTLNQLFNVRTGVSLPASVIATGTIALSTIVGVVYGLDSISSPANCIIATHDGGTAIKLEKLVAGTWTTVLTTTATYVAGVLPEIRWMSANTFGLFYNGTQRGANQTISDAGTGLLHGVMSTYSGNSITGVTVS